MICYDLFLCLYKNELQKVKDKYHNCGGKEKAAEYHFKNSAELKRKYKKYVQKCEEMGIKS